MKKSKILVSAALALCMGATAVTPAFAANNERFTFTKIGDYNADGVVNVSDITALQLQLGGKGTISGTALEHIDFDGDGAFNVNDITELQKMVAGTEYKCYKQLGNSYNNVTEEEQYNYLDTKLPGKGIGYEYITLDSYNKIVTEHEFNSIRRCNFLITSKEQFCDLFKAESPEFDDEFFKENALYVYLGIVHANDYSFIESMQVDGNQLNVSRFDIWAWPRQDDYTCYNMLVKLKKSDVENVTNIFVYQKFGSE